ncbi:MAG: hypothetical protein ACFB16_10450 [Phormidesmis sp.]
MHFTVLALYRKGYGYLWQREPSADSYKGQEEAKNVRVSEQMCRPKAGLDRKKDYAKTQIVHAFLCN